MNPPLIGCACRHIAAGLLTKISAHRGPYTDLVAIYHVVCFGDDSWAGVAGDSDSGSYEWFVNLPTRFVVSDRGYGDPVFALHTVLNIIYHDDNQTLDGALDTALDTVNHATARNGAAHANSDNIPQSTRQQ